MIFQDSDDQLVSVTVADDVAFGPLNLGLSHEEVRRRVEEAIAEVGLTGFERRVPHLLSGGEKRRAALAGVLAMNPDVLLLDEPSAFLDPRGRRELTELLRGLPGTQLIASHNLELISAACDRAVLFDAGRIVADGPCSAILSERELLETHGLK